MRVRSLIDAIIVPTSLKWRAIQTGLVALLFSGVAMPLRLATNLILVQFLAPEAFGLLGTIMLIHVFLGLISDVGLTQSIIREKDGERAEFLQIAWTVKVIRSGLLTLTVITIGLLLLVLQADYAPLGSIYADPALPGLLVVSSLVVIFNGLMSINDLLAKRRLKAVQLAKLNLTAILLSNVVMVSVAYLSASVWALMLGLVANSALTCLLSHLWLDGPRMRLLVDRKEMTRLWTFGRWVILSSTFGFLLRNADRIILSANATASVFSLYVIAYNWIEAVRGLLFKISDQVVFPLIGQLIRENRKELKYKLEKLMVMQILLVVFLTFTVPEVFVFIVLEFFPEEFRESVEYMHLIALAFYAAPMGLFPIILNTQGNSKIVSIITVISGTMIFTIFLLCFQFIGIKHAIWFHSVSAVIPGQALFVFGKLWQTIGWRINVIWIVGWFILSYTHLVLYVL